MERWASKNLTVANCPSQQWTATRCHRLLRPLLTHIAALRKEVGWQKTFGPGDEATQPKATESTNEHRSKRSRSVGHSLPQRKRARYRYSLKTSKAAGLRAESRNGQGEKVKEVKERPEELSREGIILPTPVIKRVRGHPMSSPVQNLGPLDDAAGSSRGGRCQHSRECSTARCTFELELAELRSTITPSRFSLYESIFRALDALLRATSAPGPTLGSSKSLLAMCLRKVPDYIAELELWKKQDAEAEGTKSAHEDSDISFEIYSELESLGAAGRGWKHLAEVVRAHGIKVVKTAISEGLIDLGFSALLARLCNESPSLSSRGALAETIVSQQYAKPSGTDDWFARSAETRPLEILIPSSRKSWAAPFRATLMYNLLSSKLLPREWILTRDFGTIWSWTVRDLVRKNIGQETMAFIIESIRALCAHMTPRGRKSYSSDESLTIVQQTLISALTALVTTALLGQQTLAENPTISTKHRIRTINRRVGYIIRACLAETTWAKRGSIRPSTYLLLLAAFFVDSTAESTETDPSNTSYKEVLDGCWDGDDNGANSHEWKRRYETTLALTCSIAQCCGRGTTVAANTYLTKLCSRLETTRNPPSNMRQDAAFLLADQTGDLRDLAFAEALEARSAIPAVDSLPQQAPQCRTAFAGFRWDEGISEWVTASPALVPRKRRVASTAGKATSSIGDLERTSRDVTPRPRADASSSLGQLSDTRPASVVGEDSPAIGIETWIAGTRCSHDGLGGDKELEKENMPRINLLRSKRKSASRALSETTYGTTESLGGGDDDEDELWDDQQGRRRSTGGRGLVEWHAPTKRRRARGSLQSRQPLKTIPNAYFDCGGSSDDELGM